MDGLPGLGHPPARWLCQSTLLFLPFLLGSSDRGLSAMLVVPERFGSPSRRRWPVGLDVRAGNEPAQREHVEAFGRVRTLLGSHLASMACTWKFRLHTFMSQCRDIRIFTLRIGLHNADQRWYPSVCKAVSGKEPYAPAESSRSSRQLLGDSLYLVPPA